MTQKTFMNLLNIWCKAAGVVIVINGCDGYFEWVFTKLVFAMCKTQNVYNMCKVMGWMV